MRLVREVFLLGCMFASVNLEANAQRTFLDDFAFRPAFRGMRKLMLGFMKNQSPEIAFQTNLRNGKLQRQFSLNESFFCDVKGPGRRSDKVPTSVHKLRPGDIDIVGAIGDSLTAGNGGFATHLLQITVEHKGVSFSIGGERTWREFLTIPNILKEFNPNLYGFSVNEGLSIEETSRFNVAELGAMSRDTPYMSKVLVKRMKSDPKVKPTHWKLITMLIGPNDFCLDMCYQKVPESIIDNHEKDLLTVFRTLRDNLPRTMLNVILPPSIEVLVKFVGRPAECVSLHNFECPCVFGLRNEKNHKRYFNIMREWNKRVIEVASRAEFHDRDDFTINIQPFANKIIFPTKNGITDFSYMSSDCFHFSAKGYSLASNALWNNMMEHEGEKSENWVENFKVFKCPSQQRPFLATRLN